MDVTVKANRAIAKGLLALTNATILTMDGEEIIERGTVLIQNNRIQKVGNAADIPLPETAKVIDLEGKFLMPGFVDSHAHSGSMGLHKSMFG